MKNFFGRLTTLYTLTQAAKGLQETCCNKEWPCEVCHEDETSGSLVCEELREWKEMSVGSCKNQEGKYFEFYDIRNYEMTVEQCKAVCWSDAHCLGLEFAPRFWAEPLEWTENCGLVMQRGKKPSYAPHDAHLEWDRATGWIVGGDGNPDIECYAKNGNVEGMVWDR